MNKIQLRGALNIINLTQECRLIDLPKIQDPKGNLTVVEQNVQIPFNIKRVYFLYDVPGGESRGGHAHKNLQQLIIAANGSFDVVLSNGVESERFHLNRCYYGLYIPKLIWRELDNFSSGSVCLVLASEEFNEEDYIRNYSKFKKLKANTEPKHIRGENFD